MLRFLPDLISPVFPTERNALNTDDANTTMKLSHSRNLLLDLLDFGWLYLLMVKVFDMMFE